MKRKFSFNLAPVKVTSKAGTHVKATPEPTPTLPPSHTTHRRHTSKDSVSSVLTSPFINRRELSPKTEQELRAACALILQNFKPSDHGLKNVDPKLDFHGMSRRSEHRNGPDQVGARKPTGAPTETRSTSDARKQGHRADRSTKQHPDLPMQANTGRRRTEHTSSAEIGHEKRKNVKLPSTEPPRSATIRSEMDADDTKSVGTPLTGSTDPHAHTGSTALTSAALTSEGSSKRVSHQYESAAAIADAQAAEWMQQELEKRRQRQASEPQSKPKHGEKTTRPPSRARSIRTGIREYMFPGSANISRSQSQETLNTMNSYSSSQVEGKQSGSSHGWRSWGLQRKSSSRSSSRPGTSKGRTEGQEQEKKGELNLNRELPPLPSLDSWNKQEENPKRKENSRSQAPGAHIATLMRPQDQQQEYAAAVRKHHRRSGSDTLAIRYAKSPHAQSSSSVGRTTSQRTAHAANSSMGKAAPKLDVAMDFDHMISAMGSSTSRTFDDHLHLKGHARHHSGGSTGISRSPSVNGGRLEPPNFSRKISTDAVRSPKPSFERYPYQNTVRITSPPAKEENKSKLKRVLSGWLKKETKENWMDQLEKNGVKGGVMIQDEAALPPVVRY